MKADQVLNMVEEIENTITEAGDLKVGDAVIFKPKTHMAGVQALIQNIHASSNEMDVRIGGGNGLIVKVPMGDLLKVKSHPGVGA